MAEHPTEPLLNFVSSVSGNTFLKVEEDLGEGFVRLNVSEAERRQAKHDIQSSEDILIELLRNARDAGARRLFIASSLEEGLRRLTVIDDGRGVPAALRKKIFEPRVTSKLATMVVDDWGVHGRGMALYSIAQNTKVCRLAASGNGQGSALEIAADTQALKERADQSTWPQIKVIKGDQFSVESGPRNLLRTAIEFACQHPQLSLYFGSPAEVAATMRFLGIMYLKKENIEEPGDQALPIWLWPAQATNGAELYKAAQALGMALSERNAYRVLRGEIAPLGTMTERLRRRLSIKSDGAPADIYRDARGLKIERQDMRDFKAQLEQTFDELASKYYLSLSDDVQVRVMKHAISVRFPFLKED